MTLSCRSVGLLATASLNGHRGYAGTDDRLRLQMGDRTNLVLILAGELLRKAEYLLTMGLHPSEVVLGYELARDKAIEELESESRGSSHTPPKGLVR